MASVAANVIIDRAEEKALLDAEPGVLLSVLWHAQQAGDGCLPWQLGLGETAYVAMARRYLPAMALQAGARNERGELRQALLDMREDEWNDIRGLLLSGRRDNHVIEEWLAAIVSAACLGGNHLWRDLGLPNRLVLGALLKRYFPGVADKNVHDMRWKKFFYKQLCEAEGGYVCRSPTCEQCALYAECFGDED